jgi:DNA invertase Pin-like site-specific DNA recombinase
MTRKEARQLLAEYLKQHPELSYREIAETLNCGLSTVAGVAREFGVSRQRKAFGADYLSKLTSLTEGDK